MRILKSTNIKNHETKSLKTSSKLRGKIIYSNEIIIKDINKNGMCFETSLHLNIKSTYRVEVSTNNNGKKLLSGETTSSFLKGTRKEKDNTIPIYEVALQFIDLNDIENQFLNKHISETA